MGPTAAIRATNAPAAESPDRRIPLWLAAAGALSYANSFGGPFLFDDPRMTEEVRLPNRPLSAATFLLNRAWSGAETWSYHLVNLLVHLAAGLALYGILRRTLERAGAQFAATAGLAFTVALLWLVHPLQTQAVTYLSQRAEAMAGLCVLAGLYALLRSADSARPRRWQAAAWLAFVLGMASKETAIVAPLLWSLYDRAFLAGSLAATWRERRGFYASLAAAGLTLFVLFQAHSLVAPEGGAGFALEGVGPLAYARSQPGVILHYLRLAFWPWPLCLDYGWPLASAPRAWVPQSMLVGALLLATLWALVRRPRLGFVGAWFFLCLAPSSSFVPLLDVAVEHRMYLALAAVVLAAVLAGQSICARLAPSSAWLPRSLAVVLVTALLLTTLRRNRDYASPVTMWTSVVACAPANPRAHCNLGYALIAAGRPDEAREPLARALELWPDFPMALVALANAEVERHERDPAALERALDAYRRALALEPSASAHYGLGNALFHAGDFRAAEAAYRAALVLEPEKALHHYGRANALERDGRREEAIAAYATALRLQPDLQEAHTNLAATLADLGRPEEALPHQRRALELAPDSAAAHFNLGHTLVTLARLDEALVPLRAALRLDPDLLPALLTTARLLALRPSSTLEERHEAVQLADHANRLTRAEQLEPLETLGLAHAAAGDPERAVAALQQALAHCGADPACSARLQARIAECRGRRAR